MHPLSTVLVAVADGVVFVVIADSVDVPVIPSEACVHLLDDTYVVVHVVPVPVPVGMDLAGLFWEHDVAVAVAVVVDVAGAGAGAGASSVYDSDVEEYCEESGDAEPDSKDVCSVELSSSLAILIVCYCVEQTVLYVFVSSNCLLIQN